MTENQKKWCVAPIEQLLRPLDNGKILSQGWSPQCEKEPSESHKDWGVLKTTAIQAGVFQPKYNKRLPEHLDARPQIEVKEGDILMTCAGPRYRCGVACLVRETRPRLMMSGKMYRFCADANKLDSKYLEAFINSPDAQDEINKMKTGISDSGLNLTHGRFKMLSVPYPPIEEQRRIVAEIEKQFTRLDAGVDGLKRVQANLKRYRAAVLKAACEGKLVPTEAELGNDFETGEELLKRILEERRKNWSGRGKYKEPAAADTKELPEGWAWATLGQVFGLQSGKFISAKNIHAADTKNKYPCFGGNGIRGYVENYNQEGSFPLIGRQGALCGNINFASGHFYATEHAVVVKTYADTNASWAAHFLTVLNLNQYSTATAQPGLSVATLNKVLIPLPPLAEQKRIVEEVDRRLSVTEEMEAAVAANLKRATRLRQSILKKAFEGKLV